MTHRIDTLQAPLLVTWQLTRDCDLACLHCCTESAPGKRLADELTREEALRVADESSRSDVPYVMLCGGEPLVVPHFFDVAEALGARGVDSRSRPTASASTRRWRDGSRALPIRSIQMSLDGDTQEVYARQRPGGSLAQGPRRVPRGARAGLPLEITFAPTRINIHEAGAVIERARALGAFRFNSGRLMRMGTAARHWSKLEPTRGAVRASATARARGSVARPAWNCATSPSASRTGLRAACAEPPATLLVLPNGWVKVAAALPHDLRRSAAARRSPRRGTATARRGARVTMAARCAARSRTSRRHAQANGWQLHTVATS